jgi:protein TonB
MLTPNPRRSDLSFDEIVFENRNHAYGAFLLRKQYDRNILTGFFFSAGLVLTIVSTMYIMGKAHHLTIDDINHKIAKKHEFKILEVVLPEKPEQPKGGEKSVIPPAGSDKLKMEDKTPTPVNEPIKTEEKKKEETDSLAYNPGGNGKKGPIIPEGGGGKEKEVGSGGEGGVKKVFDMAEIMPEFPGGEEALFKYLGNNIRYPNQDREAGITGVVYVSFVVNVNGVIDDIKINRSPSKGLAEEVIRVVSKMPNWKAGIQGGQKVPVRYNLPVKFSLKN